MESLIAEINGARLPAALFVVLAYLACCTWFLWGRDRARARRADPHGAAGASTQTLLAYASQTGFAEELARRSARFLADAGTPTRAVALGELSPAMLQQAPRALFVVSTTGEGDAPDSAAPFVRKLLGRSMSLPALPFAVLALGDRDYRNYCAFGHQLHRWLAHQGATPLSAPIEVDNGDEHALQQWQQQLQRLARDPHRAVWETPQFDAWQLVERRLLNPGSAGGACFHLALSPPAGMPARWNAGDIAVIDPYNSTWDDVPAQPQREYSIASVPQDGTLHLLVRQMFDAQGTPGLGSDWLTRRTQPGDTIALRIRVNSSFHAPSDDRPLILIGNGTGIAGLRALLKARVLAGHRRNWLLFGERHADRDDFYREDLQRWHDEGYVDPLDRVFSRDSPERRYVQHRLLECAPVLRRWVEHDAAIYVCGSQEGMAPGVDAALTEILGPTALADLREAGRYRHDVY